MCVCVEKSDGGALRLERKTDMRMKRLRRKERNMCWVVESLEERVSSFENLQVCFRPRQDTGFVE